MSVVGSAIVIKITLRLAAGGHDIRTQEIRSTDACYYTFVYSGVNRFFLHEITGA